MTRIIGTVSAGILLFCTSSTLPAAELTWGGSDAEWESADAWRDGDANLTTWTDGHTALLDATGGANRVITILNNNPVATSGIQVTDDGYTITSGGSSYNTAVVGPMTIAADTTLDIFADGQTGTRRVKFDSISGNGTLDLNSFNSPTDNAEQATSLTKMVLLSAGAEVGTNITITSTGGANTGRGIGFHADGGTGTTATISGNITNNAQDHALTGLSSRYNGTLIVSGVVGGSNGLALQANDGDGLGGTVELQAANTYEGDTHFFGGFQNGLKLNGGSNTLPTGTRLWWGMPETWTLCPEDSDSNPGGRLNLNGLDQQVVALMSTTTGAVGGIRNENAGATSTLTISGDFKNGNYSGAIGTGLEGTTNGLYGNNNINLVKAGSNMQTLGGSALDVTYTGTTTITGGTLVINGDFTNATGNVTVQDGGTLAGSGTLGGATTVEAGGTHSAGNSPGVQTFLNGLNYQTDATFVWELTANTTEGAGSTFDQVDVTGSLTIAAGALVQLVFDSSESTVDFEDPFWDANQTWKIIGHDGGSTGIFTVENPLVPGKGIFNVTNEANGVYLNYVTTIPEPASLSLLAAGAGLLAFSRGQHGH